jgi:hypothetical protein
MSDKEKLHRKFENSTIFKIGTLVECTVTKSQGVVHSFDYNNPDEWKIAVKFGQMLQFYNLEGNSHNEYSIVKLNNKHMATKKVTPTPNATSVVKRVKEFVSDKREGAVLIQKASFKNWLVKPSRRDRDDAIKAEERLNILLELEEILA